MVNLEVLGELDTPLLERQFEESKFTEFQKDYLRELIRPEEWDDLSGAEKSSIVGDLFSRLEEMGITNSKEQMESIKDCFPQQISDDIVNYSKTTASWGDYIFAPYEKVEAPTDIEQIGRISDVLIGCKELSYNNWEHLDLSEKVNVLNELESSIAEIECRPECPIFAQNLPNSTYGGYNPETHQIVINKSYLEKSGQDFGLYLEMIDTIIHEGRHAYQDYNVTICEVHSRHSEVNSWRENMGAKWNYWGDTSNILGQRLYEQQAVEIDARNFAADVLRQYLNNNNV